LKIDVYIFQVHFRADEWDVNKWAWEGVLKVISKGEECIIRLEDKTTGKIIFKLLWEQTEWHIYPFVVSIILFYNNPIYIQNR
jgi:hypothetical protein